MKTVLKLAKFLSKKLQMSWQWYFLYQRGMENPRKIPSPISSLIQRALDYDSSIIYCFFKISIRQAMKIEVQKSFHLGAIFIFRNCTLLKNSRPYLSRFSNYSHTCQNMCSTKSIGQTVKSLEVVIQIVGTSLLETRIHFEKYH